jgi:hypothetical protein
MGAPTSATLPETFIQHLEQTIIYEILSKHQIIDYHRYVYGILIVYNKHYTNIENTLDEFNKIHPKIKFTMEKETQNRINYLDLTVIKEDDKLTFGVYRKPTTTNSIIRNDSCHPSEHKKSVVNYLVNSINTYPLTQANKDQEQIIITEILKKNEYQQSITNHKHINKSPTDLSQAAQRTQKEKEK